MIFELRKQPFGYLDSWKINYEYFRKINSLGWRYLHHALWFFSVCKKIKNINLWKWFSRTCYALVYVSFIDEFTSWHLHHGGNHRTVKGVGAGQFFEWKSNNYFMEIIHNTQILSYVAEKKNSAIVKVFLKSRRIQRLW